MVAWLARLVSPGGYRRRVTFGLPALFAGNSTNWSMTGSASPCRDYGYYANRVRGDRAVEKPGEAKVEAEPANRRRCSASWARLIAKVFHADPLTCRKCGGKLKVVAYLHDTVAIKQILDYLGLSPPEEPKPPPAVHEVVRVPVDEGGREMEAPCGPPRLPALA